MLRLPEVPFTEDLRDPLSSGFKTQARSVEEWMKSIFAGVVRDVNIVAFRYVCIIIRNLRTSLLLFNDCLALTTVNFHDNQRVLT